MQTIPSQWDIEELPAPDKRLELVEKIISSRPFRRASQLRDILLYVVIRSLTEDPATISEQEIGFKVLDRGPDFDPGHDNIVRAQMRHLRMKLKEFYQDEGRDESLVLTIPKGHYVARFEPRSATGEALKTKIEEVAVPAGNRGTGRTGGRGWQIGLVLAVLALCVVVVQWRRSSAAVPATYSFYEEILGPIGTSESSDAYLVMGNPVVVLYAGAPSADGAEIGVQAAIPVPPELAPKLEAAINGPDKPMPHRFILIKKHDYTGIGEAVSSFHVARLMQILGRRLELMQARFLSWDAARQRDLIILGSPEINDWAYANAPQRDFSLEKMGVRLNKPGPDEPDLYPVRWDESGNTVLDHGLIWSWYNASGARVLVLASASCAGTGAVGSLLADPDAMRPIYDKLKESSAGDEFPSDWQVVVRIDIRDNLPIRTAYVTHRVYPPGS